MADGLSLAIMNRYGQIDIWIVNILNNKHSFLSNIEAPWKCVIIPLLGANNTPVTISSQPLNEHMRKEVEMDEY